MMSWQSWELCGSPSVPLRVAVPDREGRRWILTVSQSNHHPSNLHQPVQTLKEFKPTEQGSQGKEQRRD